VSRAVWWALGALVLCAATGADLMASVIITIGGAAIGSLQ
jgi:hypothetical protein